MTGLLRAFFTLCSVLGLLTGIVMFTNGSRFWEVDYAGAAVFALLAIAHSEGGSLER